jgi:hypothetical protein
MNAAISDPFCYYGYVQIGKSISNFIEQRIDYHLSYQAISNLYNDQDNIVSSINNTILNELGDYIPKLYRRYNSSYTKKQLTELNIATDLMKNKFDTVITTELNKRINYLKCQYSMNDNNNILDSLY